MRIFNRLARRDYQIFETFECGIVLTGNEVKSVLAGRMNLDSAYVRLKEGEAWLVNAFIAPYQQAETDSRRTRKILLHKREVILIQTKMKQKKLTIIPLSCYTKGRKIKLEIGLARGRREFEKRKEIKERDIKREQDLELKSLNV